MAATYSEGTGVIQAQSYTDIIQVLQLLPDNTQKQIGPRDVRDAILSAWENPPFRWTKSNNVDYIGLDRSDIKGVKLFFGKKELSNTPVLSSTLLSSNVDVFFYNTKPDSDPNQNLKISFLAGDLNQFSNNVDNAPSLSVVKISGTQSSLDLNLSHNQSFGGNFNFIAGQFGRISLNSLVFPSSNEILSMVGTPTQAGTNDLFLVRNGSGIIEFKTPASVTSTIGDSNTTLNLFGSNVFVNGFDLEFTDLTPTPLDFGGIPAGSTFSGVALSEMIRRMLYPYLPPLVILSLPQTIFEADHDNSIIDKFSIDLSYIITQRTLPVISTELNVEGVTWNDTISGLGTAPGNYNLTYVELLKIDIQSNSPVASYTFSVTLSDGTQSSVASEVVKFVFPYFYGFSDLEADNSNITTIAGSITKKVDVKSDQSVFVNGDNEYLYFMYPSGYGLLDEIEDTPLLTYDLSSFTYSVLIVNSPEGKWNSVNYLVYRTINKVTIPLPSKNLIFKYGN